MVYAQSILSGRYELAGKNGTPGNVTNAEIVASPRRAALRLVEAVPGFPPATVELRALGPVEAVVAGRLADLGAPKQRALLALLLSRVGQPLTVDVMLEELWAGRPPPSAVTSLQAYVANLRKALEPDRAPRTPPTVLRTRDHGYLLDRDVVDVDVHRFGERATAGWQAWDRGDPRRALSEFEAGLALWRGQAYAEVADTATVMPEVARLEDLRLSVTEGRCAALLAVGAHEVAVAELEAFTQANPLREYGCELLSLALYRAGRQADALAVLRTNQKRLAEELGIEPRPALQQLQRDILNQAPALEWHPTPAVPAIMAFPPNPETPKNPESTELPGPPPDGGIFAGREAVLGQLAGALAETSAGRGRVVTVSGEPGVGKTSLLRRFAQLAGVPVLWGSCPENLTAPPLWPWEQVLCAMASCRPQECLPAPIAELLQNPDAVTLRRFEAIVHYLIDASRDTPLVVVLDHLHRADPSSLRLLAHLAESVPESRLLVVVSYQPGEAATLAETSAALARTGMTRVELTGLNIQDTRTLASALLHREVNHSTAERLWARTEGNPFFLRELISSDRGLEALSTAPVPGPVREVVLGRIAQLGPAAVEVLSVAAIAGQHFDIYAVAEAASIEIETALQVLEGAVAARLVVEDQLRLGWFRFTHVLIAETLYEATGRLRRARLQLQLEAGAARAPDRPGVTYSDGGMSQMTGSDGLAEGFESHRARLRAVAYRMLGSLAEADDAVQEAWLRLSRSDADGIENLGGWLTTVVGRVCLNVLRSRTARREEPIGVYVPDPVISGTDGASPASPEDEVLLADSVGLALQVVLDTLAPAERLAFVLHDMFDLPFDEIAPIVGRPPATARQLASRARRRVRGSEVPVPDPDTGRQRAVVDAFFAAARRGDLDALVAVLDPDIVLRSDAGTARPGASVLLTGAAAVAGRALMFAQPATVVRPVLVNGAAGVVVTEGGRPVSVMGFTVSHGKITEIDAIADPGRLLGFGLT
jgi:RNA polymerase sigma factor (sigma-70 family)